MTQLLSWKVRIFTFILIVSCFALFLQKTIYDFLYRSHFVLITTWRQSFLAWPKFNNIYPYKSLQSTLWLQINVIWDNFHISLRFVEINVWKNILKRKWWSHSWVVILKELTAWENILNHHPLLSVCERCKYVFILCCFNEIHISHPARFARVCNNISCSRVILWTLKVLNKNCLHHMSTLFGLCFQKWLWKADLCTRRKSDWLNNVHWERFRAPLLVKLR